MADLTPLMQKKLSFSVNVHLGWIIAVLLAVISVLLWRTPSGENLANFLGFAASISSLILAIVAIFYSILSNSNLSILLSEIGAASSRISDESIQLRGTADKFEESLRQTRREVEGINPQIERLHSRIDEGFQTFSAQDPAVGEANGFANLFRTTRGVKFAFYAIAKCVTLDKRLNYEALPSEALRNHIKATVATLHGIRYCGFICSEDRTELHIIEAGTFDFIGYLAVVESRDDDRWTKYCRQIDEALAGPAKVTAEPEIELDGEESIDQNE